jgi:biotin transport system ATP-binding protein
MENNGLNLTAENISFGYPGQKPIISDLSFKLRGGEILGLAGQNGAGKSTLLDLLAGIKEPTQGQIKVLGLENESGRRKRIALLPQNVDFFILGDTPREDLELALSQLPNLSDVKSDKLAKNSDSPSINDIVTTIAKRWALLDLLDSPVETLSLGQKKRLALASSMAVEPAVLLLDEPFSGLDWPGSLNFL